MAPAVAVGWGASNNGCDYLLLVRTIIRNTFNWIKDVSSCSDLGVSETDRGVCLHYRYICVCYSVSKVFACVMDKYVS